MDDARPSSPPEECLSLDLEVSLLLLREDVGESYEAVVRSGAAAVGAEACSLTLFDADTGELIARRPSYLAAERSVPQYRFPLDSSPSSAHVIRTGEPYVSNDPGSDPLYDPSVKERGVRSVLTVPVRHGQRILGLLYAVNKPGGFGPDDVRTLTALAGAAAVTLENVRLYGEERERRLLSESLREVSRTLITTPGEDASLAGVLDQMWRVLRFQAAALVMREGERLRVAASRGGEAHVELDGSEAPELAAALAQRQGALVPEAHGLLRRIGIPDAHGPALIAPLLSRGLALGALVVAFDREHSPSAGHARLAEAFADHVALFLEAGAVQRREWEARGRAAALARIARLAATRHDPEALLQAAAPELLALAGADRVVIYLRDSRSGRLRAVGQSGTNWDEEAQLRQATLDPEAGPLATLLVDPRPLALAGDALASELPELGARSLLALPLVSRDELLGLALFICVERVRFEPGRIEFLADVAQQLALGVGNARLFAQLSQLASTDELTQLANRRRFTESFRLELSRSRRAGTPLSLLMADVDHLKRVNDSFGHPAGDAAIRHVADVLRRERRDTDVAARLGGEEFALLLPGTDLVGAVRAAERVRRQLAGSSVPGVGVVTVSLGVATCPEDGHSEEDLVRVADERLYAAKALGRNRVCYMTLPGDVTAAGATRAAGED